jgi:hypothetical protein
MTKQIPKFTAFAFKQLPQDKTLARAIRINPKFLRDAIAYCPASEVYEAPTAERSIAVLCCDRSGAAWCKISRVHARSLRVFGYEFVGL